MADSKNFIHYKIFKQHKKVLAFTTTKKTFVEKAPRFTGNSDFVYSENRKQLASLIGIDCEQLVFPRQTHGSSVAEIYEFPENELTKTDALITTRKKICLCIQTADCVPILLFDPDKEIVAAVHAGWRGTVSKIAGNAVRKMINLFGASVGNIIAVIGPSISPEVYEVGDEVIHAAEKSIPNSVLSIISNPASKSHFNLWEANRQILIHCGLRPENIEVNAECSYNNDDKYFSARREGPDTGRMVSGIMLV